MWSGWQRLSCGQMLHCVTSCLHIAELSAVILPTPPPSNATQCTVYIRTYYDDCLSRGESLAVKFLLETSIYDAYIVVQWNPFTPDTIGTTVSVLISGVSLFQGLILYTFVCICGKTKCLDLRGVRGVWSEVFHCIPITYD